VLGAINSMTIDLAVRLLLPVIMFGFLGLLFWAIFLSPEAQKDMLTLDEQILMVCQEDPKPDHYIKFGRVYDC